MLPLLVRITNTQTGDTEHSAFASSPVRIGRNQLNELVINEPFVSQWHAVVRFDESTIRYVDLGSTNGTMVNGHRLQRHMPAEVDPQVDLRIGPVQLAFARSQVTPDMYAAPKTTIFSLHAHQVNAPTGVSNATMAFNPQDPSTVEQATMFMTGGAQAHFQPDAQAPPTIDAQALQQAVEQVRPYHEPYRQAWRGLLGQVQSQLEHASAAQRPGIVFALTQEFPQLLKEPEFRQLLERLELNAAALGEIDVTEWLTRLTGTGHLPAGTQVNTAVAMERVGMLLESFSTSFVELRKGYEQFGEEMALQLVQEKNPLHDADSSDDVLHYLLDWTVDGQERIRQLTRAFADLALHQVAVLSGVMEGVRSMLGSVSPQTLSGQRSYALAKRGGGGLLEGLFNSRKARLWKAFTDAHQKLTEEDRFQRDVFGRDFARAYFTVTGGHLEGGAPHSRPGEASQRRTSATTPPQ